MAIPVKVQDFEGPLDLLLHLIEKNKMNIFDIPIVEITEQYMEYMKQLESEKLDVMSEFLVMAATLLDIKSRMLLPPEVTEEGDEIDPRSELVQRLLEYKMYKYMSYELKERQENAAHTFYKEPTIPDEVKSYREPVELTDLLSGVTLPALHRMFQDIIRRQEDRVDPIRSKFGSLKKEEVDMTATMQYVHRYISAHKKCSFRELLLLESGKAYKIVTFLTILELMKEGMIRVEQEDNFKDILIIGTDKINEDTEISSDWN